MNNNGLIASFLAACLGLAFFAAFTASIYVGWLVLADVFGPLLELLRRFGRRPQFGMRNLLSLTVMIGLACAMLRWLGVADVYGGVTFGVIFLVWAVGIVCGVEFAIADFVSQYGSPRQQRRYMPLDLWDDPPGQNGEISEPAP